MRRLAWVTLAAFALAAVGVAIAWGGGRLWKTDPVVAEFSASRTSVSERTCTGSDGHTYRRVNTVLEGTMTSADSRLNGRVVFRLRIQEDVTAGLGSTEGRMWILDGGYRKASAAVIGVHAQGALNGIFNGRVQRGSWLVANFAATWDGTTLRGELGQNSPVAPTNSAVIQSRFDVRCLKRGQEGGTGKLEVRKALSPTNDSGRFDLRIDRRTEAAAVGHDGTTGEKVVNAGRHEVSEDDASGTDLDDYTTSISCRDGNGAGNAVASGGDDDLTVQVARDADVVCVITNTRKTSTQTGKLEVRKALSPTTDGGRFDLEIDGRTEARAVGHDGTTGEETVTAGSHEVSEDDASGTDLDDYTTSISCRDGSGTEIASGGADRDLDVNVAAGADIVCVVTNTRKS